MSVMNFIANGVKMSARQIDDGVEIYVDGELRSAVIVRQMPIAVVVDYTDGEDDDA